MSQTLINALEALESQVAVLSSAVKAAEGASRGASESLLDLRGTTRSLEETARMLREWAPPADQRARKVEERRRWWGTTLTALTVLLGLLSGFTGGVVATRSGLTMGPRLDATISAKSGPGYKRRRTLPNVLPIMPAWASRFPDFIPC